MRDRYAGHIDFCAHVLYDSRAGSSHCRILFKSISMMNGARAVWHFYMMVEGRKHLHLGDSVSVSGSIYFIKKWKNLWHDFSLVLPYWNQKKHILHSLGSISVRCHIRSQCRANFVDFRILPGGEWQKWIDVSPKGVSAGLGLEPLTLGLRVQWMNHYATTSENLGF